MKRSISLAAVLCAVLFLPMARGRAQELYVGFNAANVTTNFTSGTNRFNNTYVGYTTNATNNLLNVSGAGTVLTNTNALIVGFDGRGNSLVISNGGKVANVEGSIGYTGFSSNNSALVTGAGSVWTNSANLYVGESGRSNSLVVANGGEVFVATNLFISAQAGASNNSVTVEGGRLVVTNNGQINIGVAGSGALNVTGGTVEVKTLVATNGANSVLNFNGGTIVSRGTTISNATDFYVGDTGSGATFIANGGAHNFASNMVVGNSGSGNSLIISNGATMTNFRAWIGYNLGSSNNSVLVTGTNSLTGSNSLWTNRSSLRLGSSGSGNSLVISNGGRAFFILGLISFFAESSNNTVQVTGTNSIMTSGNAFYFGYYGSASSLLVSNGGKLAGTEGYLGLTATASNNSALITGANSLWTNSANLYVGYGGSSNNLTIADGGTVAASNISIASQAGSSGTLNIGRFGSNDTAGTINAPAIAFGAGTGVLNFNQSNSTTVSAAISGAGTVNQLGSGTTTLSGANTYTGGTVVSAGSLVGTTASLQGAITNNAAVTFDQSTDGTYSGAMSGSGSLSKTGIGRLSLSGSSSYNGATTVSAGDLNLSGGSIANSAVTVASGASLSGYGSVGTIGGAGAINPGNSPGILTTPEVNPSGGTDFNLEMTGTAPTYNNASNSVNDVIRITGAPPFSQALAAGNGVFIYFSGAALFTGSTAVQYQGGFFTDQSASFASSISGATYNYYFANTNGPTTYNGVSYYNKAQYESLVLGTNMSITVTTVAQTANFGSSDINGQVMQVQVVPEPSTYALLALAAAGWGAHAWRRRKQVS